MQECPAVSARDFIHLSQSDCANQHAITLEEGKIGSCHQCRAAEHFEYAMTGLVSQKPGEHGAGLRINVQRAPRSSSRSSVARCRFSKGASSGYKAPAFAPPRVTSPFLANTTSPEGVPRLSFPGPGGTSSATTSPRSVTKTLSPDRTSRTYSLKRFFNSRRPTLFMIRM